MLFLASISASAILMSCFSQNGEKDQNMTKYDSAESDHSIPENPSSVPIDKEQTGLEEHEEPPSTRSANDK